MKICHISTGFPISFQGGVTNYVRTLAEYQCQRGHDVYVLSGPDNTKYTFKTECYKSKKIVPMRWRAPIDKDGLKNIKNFLEENQFDLIHIHMMLDIDWDIYEVLKSYRYIVSLHDYFFICPRIQMLMHDNTICTCYREDKCARCISLFNTIKIFNGLEYRVAHKTRFHNFRLPEIPQSMTKKRYLKFKMLLEHAAILLPVSNRVQEIFRNSGIDGNYKVLHIGNLTADKFSYDFEFNWTKPKIDITMLGTLTYLKGADIFIQMAKHISKDKVNFHFYGRSNAYGDKIKEVGIIDHGPYKQEDLSDILKETDLGLCLSVWEDNGPQVVMEFLNNHIPVIGTRLGGIPDFVKDGENGLLFDPYSTIEVENIIKSIEYMNRDILWKLTENICPTISVSEHCKTIEEIYSVIIDEKI